MKEISLVVPMYNEEEMIPLFFEEIHKVLNKFCYSHHKEIIKINNIECTPNHQFYVIDKKDKELLLSFTKEYNEKTFTI